MRIEGERSTLDGIGAIVGRGTAGHYCLGTSQDKALSLIDSLPIALPKDGEYLFQLKENILFISEARRGVAMYRPTDGAKIGAVIVEPDGIHLEMRGIRGLEEVVLVREAMATSPRAVSVRSLTAPIDLLDAYRDLRAKSRSGNLTAAGRERLDDLIDKIGDEYEKHRRQRIMPSSRSTPASCGESRPSGFRSTGG